VDSIAGGGTVTAVRSGHKRREVSVPYYTLHGLAHTLSWVEGNDNIRDEYNCYITLNDCSRLWKRIVAIPTLKG